MGQIVTPRINGLECSFASIELGIDGLPIAGIKSINYKTTHDMVKVRGTSSHPLGATRGDEDQEGDMELYRRYWKLLLLKLGDGYAENFFPMKVTYAEQASPDDVHTDSFGAVKIISPEASNSQGPDAGTVKVTLFILTPIKWNGLVGLQPR